MKGLLRGYGPVLVTLFFGAAAVWGLLLIILPQIAMFERALVKPKRQLDSSIAAQLERDAANCVNILGTYAEPVAEPAEKPAGNGGMAIPSMSAMSAPSPSTMAIPSLGGAAPKGSRPYFLQCDRTTTHKRMVREGGEAVWLDELHNLPPLAVLDSDPIEKQIDIAKQVETLAADLYQKLLIDEANASKYGLGNFANLVKPVLIPLSDAAKAGERGKISTMAMTAVGLRFEKNGEVYTRIGLLTLTRTLLFAVAATGLALLVCYPIAYKVALATPPERAVWLFLGLIIPYAIVELMRIYAWTSIIDNQGLLNEALLWIGAISEPVQFKRSALTIFVVIVYTYVLFMVFPIFNTMSTLDRNQIEAARDLGASSLRLHWRVIIPHAKPGIAVGCIATFMLAAGAFSVPRIISRGLQAEWFSQTIYNKFFESENSNVGAAYSLAYTLICFLLVALFMWIMRTRLKDFARVQ